MSVRQPTSAAALAVLERQRIESEWYPPRRVNHYSDDASVELDPELVDLRELRKGGRLRFRFFRQPRERGPLWLRLALRILKRLGMLARSWSGLAPPGVGLRTLRARPEMIALLNEIAQISAEECAAAERSPRQKASRAKPRVLPLYVNSILRTIDHQRQLAALGYVAPLPSAHCAGYAADIEEAWYEDRRPEAHACIARTLDRYRSAGICNVIEEGKSWHVCLHPLHREAYRRIFFAQTEQQAGPQASDDADAQVRSHLQWMEARLAEDPDA